MRFPGFRTTLGIVACGVYVWRVQDPKGSYAVFYDVTAWLTAAVSGLFVADGAVTGFVRNAVNLVLVDQAEGFLLGIVFVTLLAAILWPFKACGQFAARKLKSLRLGKPKPQAFQTQEALLLTERINPQPRGSSRPGSSSRS